MTREVAFSNGTQGYGWMDRWCHRCRRDAIFRNTGKGPGCPIIAKVLCTNEVPPEWFTATEEDEIFANYTCIEFRGPGGGNPEPRPKPEPPQDGLFERPERGTRMLLPLIDNTPAPLVGASSGFPNQEGK